MTKRDLVIFFSLAAVWAMSFIFYRVGVPEFGAVTFASLRVTLAGITMPIFLLFSSENRRGIKENWKLLAIIGLLSTTIPYTLFAFSSKFVNAGVLSVINASAPMMSGFIASVFFQERLSRRQLLGLLIGIIGVIVLMSEHFFSESMHTEIIPMLMALFACIGYAVGATLTRHHLKHMRPIAITAGSLMIAGTASFPIVLWTFPYDAEISLKAWASVFCIGIISTALALIFMNQLIHKIGAMRATSITLVIPVFTIMLGYILLGEALDIMAILGSLIILTGTYLSLNLNLLQRRR